VIHRQFLQEKISLRVQERGEGTTPPEMHADGLEALIQTANEVEDEGAVGDDFTQVAQRVRHALQLLAVVGDVQIALNEVAELGVEEEGACLAVVEELGLHRAPGGTSSGVAR
jgi:hypothetical protein